MQVYERNVANVANYNHSHQQMSSGAADAPMRVPQLRVPRVVNATRSLEARCKRAYDANAHLYFINSVSASPDQGTFVSSDDLCIHLWNLERADSNQVILDMRPVDHDYTAVSYPPGPPRRVLLSVMCPAAWWDTPTTSDGERGRVTGTATLVRVAHSCGPVARVYVQDIPQRAVRLLPPARAAAGAGAAVLWEARVGQMLQVACSDRACAVWCWSRSAAVAWASRRHARMFTMRACTALRLQQTCQQSSCIR